GADIGVDDPQMLDRAERLARIPEKARAAERHDLPGDRAGEAAALPEPQFAVLREGGEAEPRTGLGPGAACEIGDKGRKPVLEPARRRRVVEPCGKLQDAPAEPRRRHRLRPGEPEGGEDEHGGGGFHAGSSLAAKACGCAIIGAAGRQAPASPGSRRKRRGGRHSHESPKTPSRFAGKVLLALMPASALHGDRDGRANLLYAASGRRAWGGGVP